MNPLELIQQNYENFTKTEQTIAAYILNNPKDFARSSIEAAVKITNTSKAAMIRFAKKLGYNGYTEFKFDFSRFLISSSFNNPEEIVKENEAIQFITRQYCDFINQINDTITTQEIEELSKRMLSSKRVKIFALNRTALSAKQLQLRSYKIGLDFDLISDQIAMIDVAAMLSIDDFCLIFSIKDNGFIYESIVDTLIENGCKVGLVTMNPQIAATKKCTQVITLPQVYKGYAKFIDEQAIYFVFVEILLHELARLAK